jgi:phosphoribosylaminoimidazolecarboxamide formyltransferase/IMP cyclohydrolase
MKIAGLASNRGRNILHLSETAPGDVELSVVVANHADAPVLAAAEERGIPAIAVEQGDDEPRESHEERILEALDISWDEVKNGQEQKGLDSFM